MKRTPLRESRRALLGLAFLVSVAAAQTQGISREQMWPAPTAEDWERPCLITWQRSYEDATAVALATGKPVLVCVNMDGEIASEHYAGIRYRRPDTAALYEPYVCVIASVYRHTPRDYDEEGRRILCPRFGSVTCGEHILIEPQLFDGFFEGQRVAPRHIGVDLEGGEMYDVYYAFDTDSVFEAIREGVADWPPAPPVNRGDLAIQERVASPDIVDRIAVENAYREGDRVLRRTILEVAVRQGQMAPVDLLRQAIFGLDVELSALARRSLAQAAPGEKTAALIAEALRVPMEPAEREALIAALERCVDIVPWARALAVAHRGLSGGEGAVDVAAWSEALAAAEGEIEAYEAARLEQVASASAAQPGDPDARLELAGAFLAAAVAADVERDHALLLLEDAQRATDEAVALGATGWRLEAVSALLAHYRSLDMEEALTRAEAAVTALPPGDRSWISKAVLVLFADGRRQAIARAEWKKEDWPPQWFSDVHSAYSVLAQHPHASVYEVVAHYDFLRRLGAAGQAGSVLGEGLKRYPGAGELHARLRGRVLWERGGDGLEAAYEAMLAEEDAAPGLEWFAGYASLVAAEFHRRRGNDASALEAYDRGTEHFERSIAADPEIQDSADHYVALAHAGRGRVAFERGDLERALTEVLASFERRADSAASLDGLGFSPVATAQMVLARLEAEEQTENAARLQAALDELDPELLKLPAFERVGPRGRAALRRRGQ